MECQFFLWSLARTHYGLAAWDHLHHSLGDMLRPCLVLPRPSLEISRLSKACVA